MKPPKRKRAAERALRRDVRRLAEMGLAARHVFALVAPEYDPAAVTGALAVK